MFGLLCASWGMSAFMTMHYNYKLKVSEPFESFEFLYDKPWLRLGPYVLGKNLK